MVPKQFVYIIFLDLKYVEKYFENKVLYRNLIIFLIVCIFSLPDNLQRALKLIPWELQSLMTPPDDFLFFSTMC